LDFRLPIACISPDFGSRRGKTNRGTIRARKKRYCTVFSEFPGFPVHRIFRPFSNRPIIPPFGKRSPIYTTTPFPPRYTQEGYFLRRRSPVDRWFRGCRQGGGIPVLGQQIPVSPAQMPDHQIFLPGPVQTPAADCRTGRTPRANSQTPGRTGTILLVYRLKSSREISGEDAMNRSAARSAAASRSSHSGVMRMRSTRRIRTWATSPTM